MPKPRKPPLIVVATYNATEALPPLADALFRHATAADPLLTDAHSPARARTTAHSPPWPTSLPSGC